MPFETVPGTAPQISVVRTKILEFTALQMGKPYVWGSEGPDTFDCSGLVYAACVYAGIGSIGRTTAEGYSNKCTRITKEQLMPGDLGFRSSTTEDRIVHVAIYAGLNDQGQPHWMEAKSPSLGLTRTLDSNITLTSYGVLPGVDVGTVAILAGSVTVEPLYPDITLPPGGQTRFYDQVENDVTDPKATEEKEDIATNLEEPEVNGTKTPVNEYEKRQQIFNPKDHRNAVKEVTGKPVNNNDPYPVDLKIVEMEAHLPSVRGQSNPTTMALAAEKRIVQLENIVSVMARNLFRLSSRVQINCVYYGGQNVYGKYDCIRCLHSDLINDAGIFTLDQCLNCTRYEPVIGQVYDILPDGEQNLAVTMDTAQASYMSMEEVVKLNRIEEMHTETPVADLTHDAAEPPKLLNEQWEEGFVMDWQETPAESQVPVINSYQYGDGPLYNADLVVESGIRIAQAGAAGLSGTIGPGGTLPFDSGSSMDPEFHGAVTSSDPYLQDIINSASKYAVGAARETVKRMIEHGYKDHVVKYAVEAGVDPYLILSLITTESTGNPRAENRNYGGLMQISKADFPDWNNIEMNIKYGIDHYLGKCNSVKTTYPLFGMISYNSGQGVILGAKGYGAPPLAGWPAIRDTEAKWCDIAPALRKQVESYFQSHGWNPREKVEYFVKIMYCYHNLKKEVKAQNIEFYEPPVPVQTGETPYDKIMRLPLEAGDIKDYYLTSDFGNRTINGKKEHHNGIDLAPTAQRRERQPDMYCVAADAGTVTKAGLFGTGGNGVKIQHENGYTTVYYHLQNGKTLVKTGDKVARGQRLGAIGNTGRSSNVHLHFGVMSTQTKDFIDPKTLLQNLENKKGKSLA